MNRSTAQQRASRTWRASLILAFLVGLLLLPAISAVPAGAAAAAPPPETSADVLAQSTFTIAGTLREEGEPLEGVVIRAEAEGVSEETTSDDQGRWEIQFPAAGTYSVELDESTLPEGTSLAPGQENPREVVFGNTSRAGVIFQFGAGGGAAPTTTAPAGDGEAAEESPEDDPAAAMEEGSLPPAEGRPFGVVFGERALAGLTFGLILGLAAVGLSLVYGTTGLNNFSHGETVTLGAVFAFAFAALGFPIWLALIAAVIVGGLYGYLNDAVLWKPLRTRRAGLVPMMIVSIGFALTVRYVILFFFGGSTRQLPGAQSSVITMGPFSITTNNLISMIVAIVIILAVSFLLLRSRLGKATRAVADNPSLAAASGIDVDRVIRIVWVIGAALAALAGILYAYYRPGVTFNMGQQILLLIFAAVTLGGLGTIFGAFIGALFVGLLTEISTIWLSADLKYVGALFMMILVLIFRPQGLLGRKDRVG